jgi:hypothetical protein
VALDSRKRSGDPSELPAPSAGLAGYSCGWYWGLGSVDLACQDFDAVPGGLTPAPRFDLQVAADPARPSVPSAGQRSTDKSPVRPFAPASLGAGPPKKTADPSSRSLRPPTKCSARRPLAVQPNLESPGRRPSASFPARAPLPFNHEGGRKPARDNVEVLAGQIDASHDRSPHVRQTGGAGETSSQSPRSPRRSPSPYGLEQHPRPVEQAQRSPLSRVRPMSPYGLQTNPAAAGTSSQVTPIATTPPVTSTYPIPGGGGSYPPG